MMTLPGQTGNPAETFSGLAAGPAMLAARESLSAVAWRLDRLAAEFAEARARTTAAAVLDWHSLAGSAFQQEVAEQGARQEAADRDIRRAAALLRTFVADMGLSRTGFDADLDVRPDPRASSPPWFGGGPGHG